MLPTKKNKIIIISHVRLKNISLFEIEHKIHHFYPTTKPNDGHSEY